MSAAEPAAANDDQTAPVGSVTLSVLDHDVAEQLGVAAVMTAARVDDGSGSAPVKFEVDYSGLAFAYGGDFGRRLRLVQLPGCAVTQPSRRECADQTAIAGAVNDATASKVSGDVDLAAGKSAPQLTADGDWVRTADGGTSATGAGGAEPVVLALASGSSSDSGDYGASTLNQALSWAAGSNSGDFTASVSLKVPPVPGDLVPDVGLSYSSGSVDGLTASTNTQAPWTGEGWSLSGVSYVERQYRPCINDGVSYGGGDLCWVSYAPVSVVLNGHATRLLDNSGNGWKAEDDSLGWKVERLTGANGNGARDGEYFKITTMDGTQYFFGYRDRAAWGGVQRVDVFGNNPGEPCYIGTAFGRNHCWQGYRWNLDYVVDRFGNAMTYNWNVYEGNYGLNLNAQAVTYDITSTLGWIDYGFNINVPGATPTGKVTFTRGYRCFYGDCEHSTNPSVWMDTPWDRRCETWATSCPGRYAPTFWTLYKMDEMRSSVWDATAGAWTTVDWIAPSYGFPSTGDNISPAGDDTSPSLWMWKIWLHDRPPMDVGGIPLSNRVFWGNDLNRPPMTHWRVNSLTSGTGQTTTATYSAQECTRNNVYDGRSDRNPRRCFPQWEGDQYRWYHKYVVTDVTVEDKVGGSPPQRWHYDYSTAAVNPQSNEYGLALWHYDFDWHSPASQRAFSVWRGYTNVRTTHGNADGSGPQQVEEDIYYRGMNGDRTTANGWGSRGVKFSDSWDHDIVDHEAAAGRLRRSMIFDGRTGSWTSAVRHIPTITQTGGQYMGGGTPDLKAWRILETTTLTQTVMAGPTYRLHQVDTAYHSGYPLPVLVKDYGDVLDSTIGAKDDVCSVTSYVTPDLTRYLVDFPTQTLTTTCADTLTKDDYLRGVRYFYDGSTTLGALGTGSNARAVVTRTTGLKAPSVAPPIAADFVETGRGSRDSYGRLLDSFDALGRKTSTSYTPSTGTVTSVAVTGPPPSGSGSGFTTTTSVDPRWGSPTRIVDANGKVTTARYDESGRLTQVWMNNRPTSATPDLWYGYELRDSGPSLIHTKTLTPDGGQTQSYQLFDGLLRPRQTMSDSATGTGRTITDTQYDPVGNVAKACTFYNSTGLDGYDGGLVSFDDKDIKDQQRFVYDNLGRQTSAQQWAGDGTASAMVWQTTTGYDGDKTTAVTPPAGGTATTTITDIRGQTVELRQHVGGTPAGAVDTTTFYTYDRLSQLTQIKDAAANTWTFSYDLFGRKTGTVDPDAGTSTSAYDHAGQVTSTTDGDGNTLFYTYDTLGRKTELRQGSATGPVRATWTYDTVAKGQLSSTSRIDPTGTYTQAVSSYDDAYRPLATTLTAPGFGSGGSTLTYTITNTYKVNGAPATTALPAVGGLPAETLTYQYNAVTGLPTKLLTSLAQGTYRNDISYHYDGLVFREYLGAPGSQIRTETNYNAPGRRVSSFYVNTETVGKPNDYGTSKLSDSYTYDPAGNIKGIAGYRDGVADQKECFTYDHLRRLKEAWTELNSCTTPQRTGADPYWRQWTFDKLGNRLTQTDKDRTAGDTVWTYNVGTAFGVQPHQVRSITATGPRADTPTRDFSYDTAGNTTSRTTTGGAGQVLTWDQEGHFATITDAGVTTAYVYDTAGNRLLSTSPTKKTLYLPDGTELAKTGAADPLGTRYYAGIAVRDASGLRWIVADHHGTSIAQIDSATLTVSVRRSMPYGEGRTTTPSGWKGTKGYVGGTSDSTTLTHLGAREYDPALGKFISVDPLLDPMDPQSMNDYGYAGNSPVTSADPSGLKTDWDEERRYDNAPVHCTSGNQYSASCEPSRNKTNGGKPKPTTQTGGGNDGCFGGDRQTGACLHGNGGDGAGRPQPCFGGDRQTGACLPGNGGSGAGPSKACTDKLKCVMDDVWDRGSTLVVYMWDATVRRVTNPVQTAKDVVLSDGYLIIAETATAAEAIVVEDAELKRDGPYCRKEAECLTGAGVPGGADAITIGHTIRVSGDNPSDALIAHETQHVYDIENVGGIPFYGTYLGDYLGGRLRGMSDADAYRNIYWERRAYNVQDHGLSPRGWPW